MTKERLLAALDKPRKAHSVLMVVNPSGSDEEGAVTKVPRRRPP